MEQKKVSKRLLARLPVYLNYVKSLPEGTVNISATKIAEALGLGDVMVRKDLAKVSSGARRKLGYVREYLIRDMEAFLDVNTATGAVIVGAGKLGRALLDYSGFENSGLDILAGFDARPAVKKSDGGKSVFPVSKLEAFCAGHDVHIGIIAVPSDSAQEVCDRLIGCGIRAIWNFAPVHLNVPEDIVVQNENLSGSLTALRLQLRSRGK